MEKVDDVRRVIRPPAWPIGFNMTPMIDIIFQLIIFFLAVNQFQKAETDTNVALPKASKSHVETENQANPSRVVLNVRPNRELSVAGWKLAESELKPFLMQRRKEIEPSTLEVWIRADKSVPFGRVEPLLLSCAEAGIWNVGFKVITENDRE
jgi:biopolymer transport protein ExbD